MTILHRHAAALLCLTAALAASSCKKPAPDDATLTAAVQSRLAGDANLGSGSIQSSVQGGTVTLSGAVSSDAARVLASSDAAQVPGVRTVINNLTVATASATPLPAMPAPDPNAEGSVPPTRVPVIPIKPSAAVERQKLARSSTAPRPAPTPQMASQSPSQPPVSATSQAPAPIIERQPPAPAPPPAPTFRNVDLPAGTTLPVRITQTLDSATTQQGDTFSGVVSSDVTVDGLVVLPQGSPVTGRVDAVQEAAHFKGSSLLTVSLTGISRHGERIRITTEPYTKEGAGRGKNTAVKSGVGAAAGAILGGIFGGGSGAAIGAAAGGGAGAGVNGVTRGQQVQIPSESLVSFRLSNPISVRVPTHGEPRSADSRSTDSRTPDVPDQRDSPRRPLPDPTAPQP